MERVGDAFGSTARILLVVGFRMDLVTACFPEAEFVRNDAYPHTNTSRSLLQGLRRTGDGGVLWLNGDVVFDARILDTLRPLIGRTRASSASTRMPSARKRSSTPSTTPA